MSLAIRIKENFKACYTYIRHKKVAGERVGLLKDKGGDLCIESEEVVVVLEEYFILVFTKEDVVDGEIKQGYILYFRAYQY